MKPLQQLTPQDIIDFVKKVDKKTWIYIGAGALAAVLLFVFIISPAWFERPMIRQQIKSLQGQVMVTQALFLKKPVLLKTKEEDSRLISESKARLYAPGEASLLLGAISKLAIESNVSVVASQPKDYPAKFPAPYNEAYEGSSYDFVVEGGYHNMGQFISKIESNPKLLRVESFMIKSREETPEKHLAEVNLSAVSKKAAAK